MRLLVQVQADTAGARAGAAGAAETAQNRASAKEAVGPQAADAARETGAAATVRANLGLHGAPLGIETTTRHAILIDGMTCVSLSGKGGVTV